jgi:hypothetical protein
MVYKGLTEMISETGPILVAQSKMMEQLLFIQRAHLALMIGFRSMPGMFARP